MQVKTATLPIKIQGRTVKTKCLRLPGRDGNNTLLGAEFIHDAEMVINLPQSLWSFADEPDVQYQLFMENKQTDVEVTKILVNARQNIPHLLSPLHDTSSPNHIADDFDNFLQIPHLLSPLARMPTNWNDGENWGPPATVRSPDRKRKTIVRLNKSFGPTAETREDLKNIHYDSFRIHRNERHMWASSQLALPLLHCEATKAGN